MHHAERERSIRAGQRCDVFVALVGGARAARVNGNETCAISFGFENLRPEMDVGADGICAPEQDETSFGETLRVCADARADGRLVTGSPGACTNRAVELRCSQTMKEAPVH